jgi:hypothetical protein
MRRIVSLLALVLTVSMFVGCGRESGTSRTADNSELTISFIFNSAKGINRGSRVVCRGMQIGRVIEKPQMSADGTQVVVTALIDDLSPEHRHLLNKNITATISKDSLVAGVSQLTIHLSKRSAPLLQNGDVLEGSSSWTEVGAWSIYNQTTGSSVARLTGLLFEMDRNKIGEVGYYFNIASFIVVCLTLICTGIDAFLRLMQGRKRKKPSPKTIRSVWKLFVIFSSVKIALIFVVFIAAIAGIQLPQLEPLLVVPERAVDILKYNQNFLVVFGIIIALKLRLNLFVNVAGLAVGRV